MGLSGWDSNPGWREKLWVEILVVFGAQLCLLCVPDVCFFLSICLFIQHWKHFSSSTCLQKISPPLRLCSYLLLPMSPLRINFILTHSQRTKIMQTELHQELDIVTSFWKYHVWYLFLNLLWNLYIPIFKAKVYPSSISFTLKRKNYQGNFSAPLLIQMSWL